MTHRSTFTFIVVFLHIYSLQSASIQCEYNSTWSPSPGFPISERELLVNTIYPNVDLVVDAYDQTVSKVIRQKGTFESRNLRTMGRFVKIGDTVLNVGSHVGLEIVVFGKIVGPKGKLFVFQPYSVAYKMMVKNIFFNQLQNITKTYNMGAGNRQTTGYIAMRNVNTGGSIIYTDQTIAKSSIQTELVPVDRVADVLPADVAIDFALIDVERFQVQCLEGMKEVIHRSRNIVIECNWSHRSKNSLDLDSKIQELLKWLQEQRFRFYKIDRKNYNQSALNCTHQQFVEMKKDDLYSYGKAKLSKSNGILDLFIMRDHIDPNKVF